MKQKQIRYVDLNGRPIEPPKKFSKKTILLLIEFGLILIVILFLIIRGTGKSKYRKCNRVEDTLVSSARKYAEENALLPTLEGDFVEVFSETLLNTGFLLEKDFQMKKTTCSGSVKFTRVGEEYLATVDLTNCYICDSATRYGEWTEELDKKPNSRIVDVVAYYNYKDIETDYTKWTNYYSMEDLERNPMTGIDDKRFPQLAKEAEDIEVEEEKLTYYRHRDKQWKYYIDRGGSYTNFFSSEQPEGYANKDENTARKKEATEWSLNYPEVKSYRSISTMTGYRWYYMDGNKKVYWNSGAYYPTQPNDTYTEHDKNAAKLYSYVDTEWRWYNGTRRNYSAFRSQPYSNYNLIDEELTSYTSWSMWEPQSFADDSNRSYREEESEDRPRFRLKYHIYSLEKFDTSLTKEEFESTLGNTAQEVYDDPTRQLIVTYKYLTRK